MRFQLLMPDVLHWLGITKIDNMISMSDMKYDAIVGSGIPIHKRYDIPPHLIPPVSRAIARPPFLCLLPSPTDNPFYLFTSTGLAGRDRRQDRCWLLLRWQAGQVRGPPPDRRPCLGRHRALIKVCKKKKTFRRLSPLLVARLLDRCMLPFSPACSLAPVHSLLPLGSSFVQVVARLLESDFLFSRSRCMEVSEIKSDWAHEACTISVWTRQVSRSE